MTDIARRTEAFGLVADAVSEGMPAPRRMEVAGGCRHLWLGVEDRAEWDAWRDRLGCPERTVRVYESGGVVRRTSVAETVRDGVRIVVELVEDVDVAQLWGQQ